MARYNGFHLLMQKVAASRPGAWVYARLLHRFDYVALKLTGNKATLSGFLSGLPIIMLTSTGAKSGQPRTVPLIAIPHEDNDQQLAIIASNWGQKRFPAWYYNVTANPAVTGAIKGVSRAYTAREVTGEEYDRWWAYARQVYVGFPLYKARAKNRPIPIIVLT